MSAFRHGRSYIDHAEDPRVQPAKTGTPTGAPRIYLQDADVTLYQGDVLDVLRELPDQSVHMCCTSPPFYGLRDYACEGQIGLEETPDLWVERLVEVFREVRRVLRDDGTLWVELGDQYADKQLSGTPWLLAFALRADGWILRSEIIWSKPNPMPESVTDRPTTSHSRVFLLSKQARYFYDAEALREPQSEHPSTVARNGYAKWVGPITPGKTDQNPDNKWRNSDLPERQSGGRNRRTVWTIPTQPYPEAHFATWPEALCRDMILAGTSEHGVCPECGAPWERIVERDNPSGTTDDPIMPRDLGGNQNSDSLHRNGRGVYSSSVCVGFRPGCGHADPEGSQRWAENRANPVPATVLDPFAGSGTTMHVARKLGRCSIGIDLNPAYLKLAARRLQQQSLFAAANLHLSDRQIGDAPVAAEAPNAETAAPLSTKETLCDARKP